MTATHDDEVADLRRANAELQRRLDDSRAELQARTAERVARADRPIDRRAMHRFDAEDVIEALNHQKFRDVELLSGPS